MRDTKSRKSILSRNKTSDRRYPILCLLLSTALFLNGCAGSYSAQGVQYSGKNKKKYTQLPIRVHEEKLVKLLETVSSLFGIQYLYGGDTVGGFDCSGFVQYIYRKTFGARLPRTSVELSEYGRKIPSGNFRRGDLVFFRLNGGSIDHVGIYLDRNLFAHASSSRGITMGNLDNSYYKKRFAKAVRLLEIIDPRDKQTGRVMHGNEPKD